MTAKEYLGQIRKLEANVIARVHELQQVQQAATYLTGINYDSVRVQTSKTTTGFPTSEQLADMELDIERKIRELAETRHQIIEQIEALDNPLYVQVLVERYVKHRKFEDIVDIMNYSYPYVIQLHGQALMEFTRKHHIKTKE